MPRVGLSIAQLDQSKFREFKEGNFRVVNAVVVRHQFPANKETGDQEPLSTKIRLELIALNKDMKPIEGDEPYEMLIRCSGSEKADKFQPANGNGVDDNDELLGFEEGTEGNTLGSEEENAQVHGNSKLGILTASLERCGFKAEYNNGYMPNWIGLEGHGLTETRKGDGEVKDWNVFVVDKITRYPYQKGGAKPAGTTTAPKPAPVASKPAPAGAKPPAKAAAPAPTAAPAKKTAPPAVSNGDGEFDAASVAVDYLGEMTGTLAGQTVLFSKFTTRVAAMIVQKRQQAHMSELNALLKDAEWVTATGQAFGWVVEGEGKEMTVTVPAEEALE